MGYLQQNDKTAAQKKGSFPKACQSSQWHFSFISPLSIDLILELNFPKLKASRTQKREVLCLLLELTIYSKTRFMNTKKRGFFFFYCLILLYLGQGSLQHNFIIIVTMSLFVAMEACTSRQEFTLIICKVPPHTLARISKKVN